MVQELLPFLPQVLTTTWITVCVVAIAVGLFLWLLGGVWSRPVLTLAAVALGAWLGMMLPRWYLWPINSMALAVLGAVGLGVFIFAVPRIGVGLTLGLVLAGWAALATWIAMRGEQTFVWRAAWEVQNLTLPQHLLDVWQRIPETVRRVLPYAAASGMISGLSIALLWPRLSRAVCFSLTGVTMVFLAALTLVTARRPDWLILVPTQLEIQAAVLGVMVLAGIVVQWQFIPAKKEPQPAKTEQEQTSNGNRPLGISVM